MARFSLNYRSIIRGSHNTSSFLHNGQPIVMNNKVPNLHVPDETSSNSGSNARSQVAQPVKDSAQERPRKRRVQRRAEETKEKIRQAATQLFSDLG